MRIKGIRHVGILVDHHQFSELMKFYQKNGGEIIETNCFDKRPDKDYDICTCKIRFDDGSVLELTTDVDHIAFNVDKKPSVLNWMKDPSGTDLEFVYDE